MEKREILISAFRIWQKRMFIHTSLTPLASDLGVTKSAIYRHFAGKRELTEAMEEYFAAEYETAAAGYAHLLSGDDPAEVLSDYTKALLTFLAAHPGFICFLTSRLFHRNDRESLPFWPVLQREGEALVRLLERHGFSSDESGGVVRYLYTHILGWSSFLIREGHSEKEIPGFSAAMVAAFREGFCTSFAAPDYRALEAEVQVRGADLPPENRIIGSLLKVVAEEGLENASVSRIAREAGYSPSTLYSFFKNKNDMLFRLFSSHTAAFDALYHEYCGTTNRLYEKIYRLMLLLYRYLRRNTSFLVTLNWLRVQNLHLNGEEITRWKEMLPRFVSVLEDEECRSYGLRPASLVGLLWIQIIRELMELCRPENLVEDPVHENIETIRRLHLLFCEGLSGAMRRL